MALEYKFSQETAVISGTESDIIRIYGKTIVGIIVPEKMTGNSISFLVSLSGVDYYPFYNPTGTLIKILNSTNESWHVGIDPLDFESVNYIKLVSNESEEIDRNLTLILRTL